MAITASSQPAASLKKNAQQTRLQGRFFLFIFNVPNGHPHPNGTGPGHPKWPSEARAPVIQQAMTIGAIAE